MTAWAMAWACGLWHHRAAFAALAWTLLALLVLGLAGYADVEAEKAMDRNYKEMR